MKIEIVDPNSLRVHPVLKDLPAPDSELLTSLALDMEDRGVTAPLVVDEKGRVMDLDGRDKLAAALQIKLAELPIIRAASADAATIAVQSLLQRRHYSKSALAYLSFPFFETMLEEARARMVSRRFGSPQNRLPGNTAEGIARQAGVSRALFFQAAEVHKLFKKHPHTREIFESKILDGELSLGYAINGIAGHTSTAGQSRGAEDQLELFGRTVATLKIRFAKWDQIPANKRTFIANEFAETLTEAPEEIQERVFKALKAQRASHKGH
jgi:hypothetical protein